MSDKKYSILVVDDQPNWRKLIIDLLKDEFDVKSAIDYKDAITVIEGQNPPFHVVITDMRLKDDVVGNEDGLKLIEYLNGRGDQIKTILLTGYATVDTARRAGIHLKVFEYLEKRRSDGSDFDYLKFEQTVRDAAREVEQKRQLSSTSTLIKGEVFVVMPFKPKKIYDKIYQVIKEEVEEAGYSCRRADDFSLPRPIMRDVLEHIQASRFIVADLSEQRPNVFFEVGIAHALGKSAVFLTHDKDGIPSQLGTVRYISYKKDLLDLSQISNYIQALEQKEFPPFFENNEKRTIDPASCFVLLPKSSQETKLYSRVIEPAVVERETPFECHLTHNIFGTNEILEGIWERMNRARLVVADLSDGDPGIFYLAGMAHGINPRKTIYLSRDEKNIPFDLQGIPHVIYSLHDFNAIVDSMKSLEHAITSVIKNSPAQEKEKIHQSQIADLGGQRKFSADILLVTATDTETQNVLRLVREILGREPQVIPGDNINTYWNLGNIGLANVLLVQSEIGAGGPGGAILTIVDGIKDLSKPFVVMVGIAFGVDSSKQHIGDVLVSKQILDYELQRVGTSSDGKKAILVRGSRTEASARLLSRFRAGEKTWKRGRVQFGLILSGAKLIDNIDFREEIRSLDAEAIGGEMEGAGLYAAAEREKTDWILVKGICDWADGNKEEGRQPNQTLAATNATSFVLHVLQQGGFKKRSS